jgi:hypothetical protein
LGLRLDWLGSEALTWRDLLVIVKCCPVDSALARSFAGPDHMWGLQEHLLAGIFDVLSTANWQRGGDDKAERPKPLPRPGVKKLSGGEQIGVGKPRTREEIDSLLGWTDKE